VIDGLRRAAGGQRPGQERASAAANLEQMILGAEVEGD
jgi:hypothetical protein